MDVSSKRLPIMLDFLHRHNYKVTRHITSNLLMVTLVFGMSVFTFGYEASTLNTIQAMTREYPSLSHAGGD